MDIALFLEKFILILLIFALTMGVALYATLAERKVAGFLQDRLGPNRAGIFGLLQPLCDGAKLFAKEEFFPNTPNKILFVVGPIIAMTVSLIGTAVIPWAERFVIAGVEYIPQVGDVNVALLYIVAVLSTSVYGIILGGWASNNKFSLIGAIRAGAQTISYEIAMGLSIIALVMMTGSLSLREITEQQDHVWNVFVQPLTFIIFLVCSFAECNRTPFDLAECESELVNGHHTEYSSLKMGFYMFSEYASMFFSSALISVLFFGGYDYPGMAWVQESIGGDMGINVANILAFVSLFIKILFFMFFYIWVRWTIPRFRYDQLMRLGWKMLFPLALINIFLVGIGILVFK